MSLIHVIEPTCGGPTKRWLGVEFRHLAALAAIADEGSFRAAAERLGYVQSAVSQQIAFLERTLGVRVVERAPGTHPIALTDAGRLLVGHFRDILIKLGAAGADLEALGDGREGAVRLAAPASLEAKIIPEALRRLAPGSRVRVSVAQCPDDAARRALAENRADAALTSGPLPAGPLAAERVIEDPLALLVAADAPLARHGAAPTLAEIGALPLIGRSESRDTETALVEFARLGVEPRIVHASDDDATVHALVAAGIGVAIVPELSIDRDDPRVVALPLDAVHPRSLSFAWHVERALTPALEAFRDATIAACRDVIRPAVAGPRWPR